MALGLCTRGLAQGTRSLTLQRRITMLSSLAAFNNCSRACNTGASGSLVVLFSHSQLFEFQDGKDAISRAVQKKVESMVQDARDTIIQSSQPRLAERTHSWTRHELRIAWGSRRLNLQSVRREPLELGTRPLEVADTADKESALVKRMAGLDLETEPTEPLLYFVPVGLRLVATGSSIEFGLGSMDQRLVQPNHLSWALAKARDTTLARSGRVVVVYPPLGEYGDCPISQAGASPADALAAAGQCARPLKVWVVQEAASSQRAGGGSWNLDEGRAWTEILQGGLDTRSRHASPRAAHVQFRRCFSLCALLSLEDITTIRLNIPRTWRRRRRRSPSGLRCCAPKWASTFPASRWYCKKAIWTRS